MDGIPSFIFNVTWDYRQAASLPNIGQKNVNVYLNHSKMLLVVRLSVPQADASCSPARLIGGGNCKVLNSTEIC